MKFFLAPVDGPNLKKERDSLRLYLRARAHLIEEDISVKAVMNCDVLVVYNLSLKNLCLIIFSWALRKFIIYYCHEPWKRISELKEYGFIEKVKAMSLNFIQPILMILSDRVVTLSPIGTKKLSAKAKQKAVESRIILEDIERSIEERVYDVCWIGKCSEQKGFSNYIKLLEENPKLKGIICSSSEKTSVLAQFTVNIPTFCCYRNDDLATKILNKSKSVTIFHHSLTQSGVAVQALRSGCALLTKNENLKACYNEYNVFAKILDILDNSIQEEQMSAYAAYERLHSPLNHGKVFNDVIKNLN